MSSFGFRPRRISRVKLLSRVKEKSRYRVEERMMKSYYRDLLNILTTEYGKRYEDGEPIVESSIVMDRILLYTQRETLHAGGLIYVRMNERIEDQERRIEMLENLLKDRSESKEKTIEKKTPIDKPVKKKREERKRKLEVRIPQPRTLGLVGELPLDEILTSPATPSSSPQLSPQLSPLSKKKSQRSRDSPKSSPKVERKSRIKPKKKEKGKDKLKKSKAYRKMKKKVNEEFMKREMERKKRFKAMRTIKPLYGLIE